MQAPGAPSDDCRSVITSDRADGLKGGNFPQKAHVFSGGSFKTPPHRQHVESLSGGSGEVRLCWLRRMPAPQAQALSPGVRSADLLRVSPQPARTRAPVLTPVLSAPRCMSSPSWWPWTTGRSRWWWPSEEPCLCRYGARLPAAEQGGCSAQSRETQLPGIRWEASVTAPAPGRWAQGVRWALWKSR